MDETQLIYLDKLKTIKFFGSCFLHKNETDNLWMLKTFLPRDHINLNEITLDSYQIFFQKENFLCVIDEISKNNYIVIFRGKTECEKIFNEIKNNRYNQSNDSAAENNLFKHNFYLPILKEIQAGIQKSDELKNIILALVNSFEAHERREYMDLIFEASLNNALSDTMSESFILKDVAGMTKAEQNNTSVVNISSKEIQNSIIMDTSKYKFVGFFQNCDLVFRLLIFTSHEQKYCYEFLYHRRNDNYYCKKCQQKRHTMSVKVILNENEKVAFIFGKHDHICEPVEFLPQNYVSKDAKNTYLDEKYMVTIDYKFIQFYQKGALTKRLILFISPERKQCYEFYYSRQNNHYRCKGCLQKQKSVIIKVITEENQQLKYTNGIKKHVCMPFDYSPDYDKSSKVAKPVKSIKAFSPPNIQILDKPNYEIAEFYQNGLNTKRLLLFTSAEKTHCYEFYYNHTKIACKECRRKNHTMAVRIIKEENNKLELKWGKNQHICQPIEYLPDNYKTMRKQEDVFSNFKNFEVIEFLHNGFPTKRLFIFTSVDKKQCFEFYYHKKYDSFACKECQSKCHLMSAEIVTNLGGEKKLKFGKNLHICEPIDFIPNNYKPLDKEINENVKDLSNFEIVQFVKNGFRCKRLLLFTSAVKTHCYEFYYNQFKDNYVCKECNKKKHTVSIKIVLDSNTKMRLEHGKKKHICDPMEFSPNNYKTNEMFEF